MQRLVTEALPKSSTHSDLYLSYQSNVCPHPLQMLNHQPKVRQSLILQISWSNPKSLVVALLIEGLSKVKLHSSFPRTFCLQLSKSSPKGSQSMKPFFIPPSFSILACQSPSQRSSIIFETFSSLGILMILIPLMVNRLLWLHLDSLQYSQNKVQYFHYDLLINTISICYELSK